MTKGEDGIWTVTLGPLNPAIYRHTFCMNGVRFLDRVNPMIKPGGARFRPAVVPLAAFIRETVSTRAVL